MDGKLYSLCIIFKFEARLLGPFRCDKSCRGLTVVPTNEVSADAVVWSPGDKFTSRVSHMTDHFLPGARVGFPLPAAFPEELSAAKEPRALHSVVPTVTKQLGQCAGHVGGGQFCCGQKPVTGNVWDKGCTNGDITLKNICPPQLTLPYHINLHSNKFKLDECIFYLSVCF